MTTKRERHFYFRSGMIERGARYMWCEGYSRVTPTGITYPWLTQHEARRQARSQGAVAKFYDTEDAARLAANLPKPVSAPPAP